MAIDIEVSPLTGTEPELGVLEAIRTRRSIGVVRPERPPRQAIETMIEAATTAPNHRLTEPWRFFVLAGEARTDFGHACAEAQAVRRADGEIENLAAYQAAMNKPLRAPVIVAVAVEPVVGPKIEEIEEIAAGAAAIENMLLVAHALGLGAIWRTGSPAYDPAVKAFFGLAPTASILGFVYVGYPAIVPEPRRRRNAAELTRWFGWDDA